MSWNYGGYGGSNYPPSSGPPPPPGGVFGNNAATGMSAYNVNYQGYDPGYGYGHQPAPGYNAYNVPAVGMMQQQYMMPPQVPPQGPPPMGGMPQAPPPYSAEVPPSYGFGSIGGPPPPDSSSLYGVQPPPGPSPGGFTPSYGTDPFQQMPSAPPQMPYSTYVGHMQQQVDNSQHMAMQQMQQEMASMALEMKRMRETPEAPVPAEPPKAEQVANDSNLKAEIKRMFVDELVRRQAVSGTFDVTEGTVHPLHKYPADDPVTMFYQKTRSTDLTNQPWDPEADCEYLRKAMKGLGTDEDAIIHVVATRCNQQRQRLKEMFKTMYGRDLITDIHSELSGDFRETVMGCFVKPAIYDAWSVKEAIYGLGTDERALIEIFMTRTNAQIKEMTEVYPDVVSPSKKKGGMLLEKDIRGDTSGDFKKLLISAAQGNRYEISRDRLEQAVEEKEVDGKPTGIFDLNYTKLVDMNKVRQDAQRLFKAGEDRWGTNEEEFNIIFSTRDYYHLREVWNEYVKIAQRDILNSIDRETSGDFKKSLAAIVMNIRCRPMFFAERLRASMKGLGTDEKTLIRIIISRSEIDMVQIKKCFLELTKQTLWRWIKNDTSGDFKKLLQAIVGKD